MERIETPRGPVVEDHFGHSVADPYRWLEDPDDPAVVSWVRAQAAATERRLDELDDRAWFQDTMAAVLGRPRAGTPMRRGGRYLRTGNDGEQQQDVWYVADTLEELRTGGRVLVDPNELSDDGTTSVGTPTVTADGRLAAYGVSEGGSDWQRIRVVSLADGRVLDAGVQTKFCEPQWLPDHEAYLYLDFPHTGVGSGTQTAELPSGRLTLHRLGDDHAADELVWQVEGDRRVFIAAHVSHDGRWVVAGHSEGTENRNSLRLYPILDDAGRSRLGPELIVFSEPVAELIFIEIVDSRLFLLTDLDAPRGRVISVDLDQLQHGGDMVITEVVAESDQALIDGVISADRLVVAALVDASPRLTTYTLDGSMISDLDLPGGALVGLHGSPQDSELFVGLSSVTTPTTSHRVDVITGETEVLPVAAGDFAAPEVITDRRSATSPDGTAVPYWLIRRADVAPDKPRPTLLYGYGGFKIPVLADYRAGWSGWLAAGGTLVIANLRGGGEYGSSWHEAGRLRHKQNVFDDCIAVAEDLIATDVTTAAQLAVHGRSNGGLLVGAVMTQRPDLFAVALPAVGVLDMLRFHRFTVGRAWISDYGDPDVAADFETLLAYSPLHRVRPGTSYPPTLIMTGDHDDRVVPLHSLKFAAALQHAAPESEILARIEIAAGHGLGKSAAMVAAEWADLLTFAAHHTGLRPPTSS